MPNSELRSLNDDDQHVRILRDIDRRLDALEVRLRGLLVGSPEGIVDAPAGTILQSTNGNVYRKSTAAGTLTGWIAM